MIQFAIWYALMTAFWCVVQYVENRSADTTYHAPVWWIALTWPYWFGRAVLRLARGKQL